MLISKIKILNYKSFRDSGWIEFRAGINIITGQNSAGKTALLEVLTLDFQNIPHRSIHTLPKQSSVIDNQSMVELCLDLTEDEIRDIMSQVPKPYSIHHPLTGDQNSAVRSFQQWLNHPKMPVDALSISGGSFLVDNSGTSKALSFDLYDSVPGSGYILVNENIDGYWYPGGIAAGYTANDSSFKSFLSIMRGRIYRFLAERLNVGSCGRQYVNELFPNASNLPEVLGILQGENSDLFNLFNEYVSIIFPQIKRIAISQLGNIEIKVWHVDPSTQRSDLSFPLSACGTGVGQVLSILYVVLTANSPRVIIIDEPQSFLHPGAAKKLIEILREIGETGKFPQHQYIVSTHSPTIIAAAEPSTIVMLQYTDKCETEVLVMNAEDSQELKILLDEVGVRLSDVFGMDKIFWVEGPTEEKCYPIIIKKILKKSLRGIQILAIKNTGDLEGKRAHIIFDVYDTLSGKNNLFPPAIGFLFDRELRSKQEMDDLQKRSQNPVIFLARRMYENYLLHSEAIAVILGDLDRDRETPITSSDINTVLNEAMNNKKYLPKNASKENIDDANWIMVNIDGAKVLEEIFSKLSENRVEFSKTRDSVRLTEWLIDLHPESLEEISKLLDEVIVGT